MIEAVSVPHGEMWVHLNVFGTFAVVDFPAKVLHNGDGTIVRADLHDREEEVPLFLALKRWAQTHHHSEVLLLRCTLARLECIARDIGPTGVCATSTPVGHT